MNARQAVLVVVCLGTLVLGTCVASGQSGGSIVAWGRNESGQCDVPAPNADFTAVAAGYEHSLGLKFDGTIVAWGSISYVPEPNADFVAVAGGMFHSLGLKSDGTVVAWGDNSHGQCDVPEPNADFEAVAGGRFHSLGLKSDGTVVAWGWNSAGQCDVPAPNAYFVEVAGGDYHSLGLKSDGTIVAWGSNYHGQCDVPAPNADFVAVAAGYWHSLGLKSDGTIVAWGRNNLGQCGVPAPNADFVAVAGGGYHSLGLKSDGTIVAWGWNNYGQCNVPGPNADFVAVAAGFGHSLGLWSPVGQCEIVLSDTLFAFGPVDTGMTASDTLIVMNAGDGWLWIQEISIDHDDFSADPVSFWVGPGGDQEVAVLFCPSSAGPITATMTILSNDPNHGTVEVALEGEGVLAGQIAVSDTLLAFGQVCIGWPGSETLLVSNNGTGWLIVSEINADHPDFSVDPTNAAVPPGDSRSVQVEFTPSSAGLITGTLTILSDDPEHPVVEITLEGEGASSVQIAVSDTLLAFGQVCIGFAFEPLPLFVTNEGPCPLTVGNISTDNSDFSVDITGFTLPPGDTQLVSVEFAPSSVGPITGTLTITSNDPDHPTLEITLEGEGASSVQIAVSDTLLAFGQVCVDSTTFNPLPFVVTNAGLCPVIVSDISTDNSDFSVDITGFTLPPGDTQLVSVEFAPSSAGLITGTLTITSNDPDHPTLEITLEGEGVEGGHIAGSDTLLSFGSVLIGTARWDAVSVANVGCHLLTVSDISIDHEDFSASITGFSLEMGAGQEVAVEFAPSSEGPIAATLTIQSDDPDDPVLEILLEGEGLVPPEVAVSPDSLYGDLLVGETETQYITIENTGGSELVWSARAVDRAGARAQVRSGPDRSVDGSTRSCSSPEGAAAAAGRDARLADLTGIEILWDQSHGQHPSTHATMLTHLTSRGATVTENHARINDVLLSGYDVAWILDCSDTWRYTEVQALAAWVALGGSLLLEGDGDSSVAVFNDILAVLGAGIEYSTTNGTVGLTTNIHPHQTTQGVDYVSLWYPKAHLSAVTSPALPLIDDSAEVPNSACSEVGFGRVVTMAGDLANNFHFTHGNTGVFVNQVFDWLARGSTCAWLACEPSSGTVTVGGSVEVAVTLDATDLVGGEHMAYVQVRSNDLDDPVVPVAACLHVTGVPDIAVSETFLAFGEVEVGATGAETLLVANEGTDVLTVSDVSTDHEDFGVSPTSFALPPAESQAVVVEFAPSTEGLITGTLTILSDDPDEGTVLVALEGTGTSATPVEGSFYATLTESESVMLRWTVPSLTDIDGFNVYRATSPEGPFDRVNEEVIQPSSPASFEDTTVWPQTTFWYELGAVLSDGTEEMVAGSPASATTGGRLVATLYPARPNPFTGETTMQLDVPNHAGPVRLAVYNVRGQLVRRLIDGPVDPGRREIVWDGIDERGRHTSAGIYLVRLDVGGVTRTQKIAVVR